VFRKAANKWYEFYSFFAAFQNLHYDLEISFQNSFKTTEEAFQNGFNQSESPKSMKCR
jgi:hypothetical protein